MFAPTGAAYPFRGIVSVLMLRLRRRRGPPCRVSAPRRRARRVVSRDRRTSGGVSGCSRAARRWPRLAKVRGAGVPRFPHVRRERQRGEALLIDRDLWRFATKACQHPDPVRTGVRFRGIGVDEHRGWIRVVLDPRSGGDLPMHLAEDTVDRLTRRTLVEDDQLHHDLRHVARILNIPANDLILRLRVSRSVDEKQRSECQYCHSVASGRKRVHAANFTTAHAARCPAHLGGDRR
jgi:hypothetical protein